MVTYIDLGALGHDFIPCIHLRLEQLNDHENRELEQRFHDRFGYDDIALSMIIRLSLCDVFHGQTNEVLGFLLTTTIAFSTESRFLILELLHESKFRSCLGIVQVIEAVAKGFR